MSTLSQLCGDWTSFAINVPTGAAPLSCQECRAFPGFTAAASAVLGELGRQLPGIDLWLVTRLDGEQQEVITRTGRWSRVAPPGLRMPWGASLCVRMLAGAGPMIAPDVAEVAAYQHAAVGPLAAVRAYVGVPLYGFDHRLFGTLCGLAGKAQPATMTAYLPMVETMTRLLSSLLSSERLAHDRSTEAAAAYGLIDRDPVTALHNRRGFEQLRQAEQVRGRLYGTGVSILSVRLDLSRQGLDSSSADELLKQATELLRAACAGCDVIARVERDQFAVLAPELGEHHARRLAARLRQALCALPVPAVIGLATQRDNELLADTHLRASQAVRLQGGPDLQGVPAQAHGGHP